MVRLDLAATLVVALTGTAAVMPGQMKAEAVIVAAGTRFVCTPVAVWDGDGPIWCKEGAKVRLSGIAAREIDGSCRAGQPCPEASGVEARAHLVALLGGAKGPLQNRHVKISAPAMHCLSTGSAKGTRTAAWCILADGRNLSCAMIASGTVVRWPRFDPDNICRGKT
jgi:endonuclease YncB( thermonuclease family)